jgi:hypothetical protein
MGLKGYADRLVASSSPLVCELEVLNKRADSRRLASERDPYRFRLFR